LYWTPAVFFLYLFFDTRNEARMIPIMLSSIISTATRDSPDRKPR
jgi:hypothetical protein